jgi:hypothetical protein
MAGRHCHGFAEGRSENWVHRDQDAREPASFLIAVYEGYVMLAKNAQDVSVWKAGIRNIVGCPSRFARQIREQD